MLLHKDAAGRPPLFIPCSTARTSLNRTGSWRYYRPRYQEKTSPCSVACPVGQDIARIEMLGAWGLYKKAWETIVLENPFAAVCGRVCGHPCEQVCNRGGLDEPVAIHAIERFLGDAALERANPWLGQRVENGRKVAVVGSGPAGLAAACFLTVLGYTCAVFESRPRSGGLLRYGIPSYRLPEAIVDSEIRRIEAMGVSIACGVRLDAPGLRQIRAEYDAVLIAAGCSRPMEMKIAGESLVRDGLSFLRDLRAGKSESLSGPAAVIGGGNTAVDVARSLVRLGARPVIVYRRRRRDMPAHATEIGLAQEEGVDLKELTVPVDIRRISSSATPKSADLMVTLQKMKVVGIPAGGRARVVPEEGQTASLRVRHVFAAVGAAGEALFQVPADLKPAAGLKNCILLHKEPPVAYIGDLATPQKSVAHAVASAKEAAMALDSYFRGGPDAVAPALADCRVGPGPALSMAAYLKQDVTGLSGHVVAFEEIRTAYFKPSPRAVPPALRSADRTQHFGEIEGTLPAEAALGELARCFNCGTCNACDNCRLFCPEVAVLVEKGDRRIDLNYCKGCGICIEECPRNAMALIEECP